MIEDALGLVADLGARTAFPTRAAVLPLSRTAERDVTVFASIVALARRTARDRLRADGAARSGVRPRRRRQTNVGSGATPAALPASPGKPGDTPTPCRARGAAVAFDDANALGRFTVEVDAAAVPSQA